MKNLLKFKPLAVTAFALALFGTGALIGANNFGKPKSVIHVVTVKWKPEATQQQIDAAIAGVEKVAADYSGIKNVWVKTLKVQGEGYKNAFVMEFASEDALKKYAESPAQKEWYKVYLPIRAESTTHDITN